ncbi:type I-E CRISPR-associated protein Cse1/CasA [Falseniella ignava]|uniref:Type I-E CRISPR-associated protein Cse1/CasA n=1 Tax=Falseniella ignava TaxID=137730 RepID=A0A2I1JZ19_9LACT|nr:type I-E CRISPR-associated protein Cse1/CasA [Falseniella ignava]PKY88565.1 type I-E CRISPR-associated protein Cse1/CasA [Falseniella ignava]
MSRFNLLEEAWIPVVMDERGNSKEVSLKEFFENAHHYKCLAGDTRTQNFALLRFLLSILHTVYSRFDDEGSIYEQIELNAHFFPANSVDTFEQEQYEEALMTTWLNLYRRGSFTESIQKYLDKWQDRFYLFDEKYPFFQVKESDISQDKINKSSGSKISGKNINRLISESDNKIALFSPKSEFNDNKNILNESEVVRWLITYQSYTGLADKVIFGSDKYKASKGWLFDIGGIYIEEKNLFETLMVNYIILHPQREYRASIQRPCWEYDSEDKIKAYFSGAPIDNLAELYTLWSRAIYIDPEIDINRPFSCQIVKLPDLEHEDQFLEPMTLWKHNDKTKKFTPRKHPANQALWRSIGLVASPSSFSDGQRRPGLIDWLNWLIDEEFISEKVVKLQSISMKDDGNATSWVPVDEICDSLNVKDILLADTEDNYWIPRIDEAVEKTKKVIGYTYREFLRDIFEIRGVKNKVQLDQFVESLFSLVDQPFREWIATIEVFDSKDNKVLEWYDQLSIIVDQQAKTHVVQGTSRDFIGIPDNEGGRKNIITVYNKFKYFLYKELGLSKKEEIMDESSRK